MGFRGKLRDSQTKSAANRDLGWSWWRKAKVFQKAINRQMENNRTTHTHTHTVGLTWKCCKQDKVLRLFTILPPCSSRSWWSATVASEWYSWPGFSFHIHTHYICTHEATHTLTHPLLGHLEPSDPPSVVLWSDPVEASFSLRSAELRPRSFHAAAPIVWHLVVV